MFELPEIANLALLGSAHGSAVGEAVLPSLGYLLPIISALAISMALIQLMVRFATHLGMVDEPDARKVHAQPVPRVGGFGIVIGSLLPIFFLLSDDLSYLTYLAGGLVLFVFGALDDARELGHYVKFIGQFIAVIGVVYVGDVYVTNVPFMGVEPLSPAIGKAFTVFAMIGMINAMNHSDGLDGLAGGESLLSLSAIAFLAYLAGGNDVVIISLAIIGGLLGFIRFNTHPAVIFMGDSGSQFLGYSLGFLVVLLTQNVNPALSPALPLLLLGLPVADIIAVFIQRAYKRMNWFRATRNHIHHRLLDLGFHHYESVIVIYSLQLVLVLLAVLMPYESDILITSVYLLLVSSIFAFLVLAERSGWRKPMVQEGQSVDGIIEGAKHSAQMAKVAYATIYLGLSAYLLLGSILATQVPLDLGLTSLVLCIMLAARLLIGGRLWFLSLRLLGFMAVLFVVYLLTSYQPSYLLGVDPFTYVFFGVVVMAIAVIVRTKEFQNFTTTPTDFLIIIAVTMLVFLYGQGQVSGTLTAIALKSIILFYACEIILASISKRLNLFTASVLLSLAIIAGRGILLVS